MLEEGRAMMPSKTENCLKWIFVWFRYVSLDVIVRKRTEKNLAKGAMRTGDRFHPIVEL